MNDNAKTLDVIEQEIANGVQAPLVNRFNIRATAQVVRVVFFETYEASAPRAACCMSIDDAIALQRVLGEIIATVTTKGKGH